MECVRLRLFCEIYGMITRRRIAILLTVIMVSTLLTGFKFQELETADSIMSEVAKSHTMDSEIGLLQIITTTNDGSVTQRKLLSIIRKDPAGNYSYIIRFLSPENVKNVTLLTRDLGGGLSEQYLYLPALGKVKEIQGSQKASYFMGTDFTFEDLRKEKTVEYSYSRQFDDIIDGKDCHVILSTPADSSRFEATGYGSRMIYIEKASNNILKIDYFNEEQKLTKTFQAYDYNSQDVDGPTKRPRRAVMTNHEKGSTSVMVLLKSRLNFDIDSNLFSVEALEAWSDDFTQAYMAAFDTTQKKDASNPAQKP